MLSYDKILADAQQRLVSCATPANGNLYTWLGCELEL